ncbi:hypothetical protein, conserved [Eimeria acervulina]|uniref:Uncharacterized protein n=1 Tax=Eimeria acervulina TaxID=5801 RepID=U6GEI2_EIMAC|nr:hypothetical protein, conserved [Eimeria acervulina]CDI78540.1 hypothetical protein, conserved [Eimeria acervulina]
MESQLLQQLHDGLSQANNRRGRQGGLGDTRCTIIEATRETQEEDSEEEPAAAAAAAAATAAKSRSSKKSKSKHAAADASSCEDTAAAETDTSSRKHKKKKTDAASPSSSSSSSSSSVVPSVSPVSPLGAALKGISPLSLVYIRMETVKMSLFSCLQQSLPRCSIFLLVGGCGVIDVLLQQQIEETPRSQETEKKTVKHKKLRAIHLQGTCDIRGDAADCPSLSGTFCRLQAEEEGGSSPPFFSANFGVKDLFAGGRGVCEVWGFALDKKGKCIAPLE